MQPARSRQARDVISAEPRAVSSRTARLAVAALLAAALVVVIVVGLQHRDARRGQFHSAGSPGRPRAASAALSVVTARLPPRSGPLTGMVTVFAAHARPGLAEVSVTARVTGARPDTGYQVSGGACAGGRAAWIWAAGTTNARGSGTLTGHIWTVSVRREYYLELGQVPGNQRRPGPAVRGFLAIAHGLTAAPRGLPPCAP
jgi:hypothetical protein